MRLFSRSLTQTANYLTGSRARWWIRAITSFLVTLSLLLPAFPLPGQTYSSTNRRDVPAPSLSNPFDTAEYVSSLFSFYPDVALAQSGVITKTAPAIARPGETISYPIVVEKTTPSDWLTGTIIVTDTVPFYTGSPSGAPEPAWSYTFSSGVGRFQNNSTIAGTGVITVGVFNVVVDALATNGTVITNTAHFSDSLGTAVSPVVTTTIQAPEFSPVKYASSSPVCAGSLLTYTLVVSNANLDGSPSGVINVPYTEVDRLPAGVSLVSASNSPVTSANTITWTMSSPLDSLWGAGINAVTRTAVVSVPYSLNNGITLTNRVTVTHATVPSATFVLPITVTKITPDFTTNSPVGFGAPVVFTNTTIGDAAYLWDFGDGSTSTLVNPSHVYTNGGVFTPTLTATSIYGCGVLTVSHPITVVTPATITVTANPTNTYANGISNTLVTAVVSDTFGSPVANQPLTFTTSLGNWAGDGQSMVLTTNGLGIATRTLTSTVAGTAYITVTAPNGISGTVQVIFDLPSLLLTKSDSPDPVQAGGVLTYSLVYTNQSNVTALNTWITDTLPTSVTLNTSTLPTTTQIGNAVGWNIGSMAPYSSSQIVMTVLVDSPIISGTIITNSAVITAPAALTETTALVTTTIWSSHTLTVVKADALDPVDAGATLDYTLAYTVTGNEPALNAVITDAIPANTVFDSASGGITPVGGVLTWNLGNLYPPDSGVLTYSVTVNNPLPNGTVLTNSVAFSDDSGQVATDTITTTVVSSHTLNLAKSDNPDPVDAGGTLTYTLAYSITGNEQAMGVTITDTVPADTTYDSCSGCTQSGGVVTWTLGNLNPGSAGALTLTVIVDTPLPNGTVITNSAHLFDTNGGVPVSSTVTTTVVSSHTLNLIKGDNPDPVDAGAMLTYTLAYSVTGNEMAQTVNITDTVPANTTFAGASGGVTPVGGVITWPLGNVLPGSAGTLTMTVVVTSPLPNGTILTNTGHMFDSNSGTPVSSTVTTTVVSTHALNLVKSDFPDPVDAGGTLTYTLAYSITGNEQAIDATITDTIPANTNYGACTGGCIESGGIVTWTLGTLNPGDSGVLTLTVAVASPLLNGTILTNTGHLFDTNGGVPVSSTVTTTVVSSHTLNLVKSDYPDPVDAGATLTYTLAYSVTGNEPAQTAIVTDTVPANTTYNLCSGGITCGQAGGVVTWNLGDLNPGDSGVLALTVTVTSPLPNGTVLTNTGRLVDASSGTPVSSTVTTTVVSSHTLNLVKSDNPDPVDAGGTLTYTLAYSITGNEQATGVTITDTIPANTSYDSCAGCTLSGGVVTWTLGNLNPGSAGALILTVIVDSPLPNGTVITNTAHLFDGNSGTPVSSTVTTTVISSHTLNLLKNDFPDPVDAGTTLTYTLAYSVTGNEMAQTVNITDTVPANTTFAGASGGVTPVGGVVIWPLGNLLPGNAGTLTMTVVVASPLPNGTVLTNTGTIFDTNSGVPVSSTVTTTVVSTHTLNLVKSDFPDPVDAGAILTYTLAYSATGNEPAQSVVVTDTVPTNTTYNLCSGGVTCSQAGGAVTWNLGNLNPVDSGVLTLTVTVDIPLPNNTILTNTGHMFDGNGGVPVSSTVTTTVSSSTDITFTKSASPPSGSPVSPGDTITYTLIAANTGTQMATGVLLTDTLPVEVNVVSASGSKLPAPVVAGNLITWTIGTLTVNETVTATIEVTVTTPLTSGTIIANFGELFTAQTGISTTNTVTHSVISTPTLTLNKSALPPHGSGVSPGETITYTIAVTNSGNGPATNFQITDTMPISTNLVGIGATSGFSAVAGTNAITVGGTLNAGQTMTTTFAVTISMGATDGLILSNTGYVGYTESPVISATNTVTHVVQTTPAISITKLADPPGPAIGAGDTITYTVLVTNNGSFDATNLVLTDAIPANTNYVAGSAASTPGTVTVADPLRVDLLALPASQTMTFTFQVTVAVPITDGTVISNVAQVRADFLPTVGSNIITHTVVATPDLVISKSASPPGGSEVDPGDAIIYFIRVRNDGTGNVTNLIITETIPISTQYVLSQRIPPIGTETIGDPLVWTIPSLLGNGGQVEYRVAVTVTDTAPPGLIIPNVAQLSSDQTSLTTTNVVTHQLRQTPSMSITKTANPLPGTGVLPGDPITYTVRLTNTGSTTLTNVMIFDLLDGNTTLISSTTNPPAFLPGPPAMWLAVAPNDSVSLQMLVAVTDTVAGGTVITNVATGSSAQTAVVASQPVTHVVQSIPDLALAKTADPGSGSTVNPGDPITYTLWVTNSGTAATTGVVITDVLDPNLNLVSVTPAGAMSSTTPLVLDAGTLVAGGGSANFTVLVTVTTPLTNGYVINNQAQVTSLEVPTVTLSNLVTHTVVSTPNLVIIKSAEPPSGSIVDPLDGINYIVQITNTGNAPVTNLTITDTLPVSTTFFSGNVLPPGSPPLSSVDPVVVNIPVLAGNGGWVELRFSVNVDNGAPAGLIIPNTAQIVSDQTALTNTNTITHQVREAASLSIFKGAAPSAGSNVQPGETITYTITVNNTGAGDANEFTLTDFLPAGVGYVAGTVNTSPGFNVVSTSPDLVITGTLAAARSMTATLQVTVTTGVSGTILTNTAQATATNASLVTTAITHAVVVPTYNISIVKDATPSTGSIVEPGDLITYTITVANNGDPVSNVVISDTLDAFVTLVASNTTHGSVTGPNPMLASGFGLGTSETAVLTLTVQVNGVVSGTVINNRASVTATEIAALQTSGLITHVISNTIPVPSLAITKDALPPGGSSVGPNSPITYTVVVENNGSGPANNVLITDTLPAEVNLVSTTLSSPSPGSVGSSNPLTASVATLAAGNRITLTVVVTTSTVATDTVITNTAQTSADGVAVQASLAVTHVITATPPILLPNLVIAKTAVPGSGSVVDPGETITYTIIVQNTGSGTATNMVISDTLDANVGLSMSDSSSTAGSIGAGNPVQVTGFDLTPGSGVTVTLVVTVTGTTSGTVISNRAAVTSTEVVTPQVSGNVTHTISNSVTIPPNFTITKSADPTAGTTVSQNDVITYTIVIQNSGGAATGVMLTDTIPANTALVNGSALTTMDSVTESVSQITADMANFPAGGTATTTFQIRVTTNTTTTITNTATMASNETLPQSSNDVVHPVQGSTGGGNNVYLPIIMKNFTGSYVILQWDAGETVCDKVSDLDGGGPALDPDGLTDGVFWLGVNVGSEGPKLVTDIRLSSTQPFEWDTVDDSGSGPPVLGIFSGGSPLNNDTDGTISGILFNSGLAWVQLWASDVAGRPRFEPNQYNYTVTINFDDGSSLSAQTGVCCNRPPPPTCSP